MGNDLEFTTVADQFMEKLLDALDEFDPDDVDAQLSMGVLTMEFQDGSKCVMNRQTADVLFRVHGRGDVVERPPEVRNARERHLLDRGRIVDQRQGPAGRIESLVEQPSGAAHFVQEDVLGRGSGETEEVEVDDPGPLGLQGTRRLVHEIRLIVIDLLHVQVQITQQDHG